jgi:hypothetical protein
MVFARQLRRETRQPEKSGSRVFNPFGGANHALGTFCLQKVPDFSIERCDSRCLMHFRASENAHRAQHEADGTFLLFCKSSARISIKMLAA